MTLYFHLLIISILLTAVLMKSGFKNALTKVINDYGKKVSAILKTTISFSGEDVQRRSDSYSIR